MTSASVKTRFLVSVGANAGRAGISFLAGVLIARGLSPVGYGDLFFLLGSFTAIRALMDMGTSSAFYTFIAQRARERAFYLVYFIWLALQFLVTVLVVLVILPDTMIDRIWLGHSQDVILLAFFASFVQQQVWTTIIQICEAVRKTVMVQLTGLVVVVIHLGIVLFLMEVDWLSIHSVLITLLGEYLIAAMVIWWLLHHQAGHSTAALDGKKFYLKDTFSEYWVFCRPLLIIAIVSFFYEFLDRWLLQRFGGSEQQGFYQISAQFAAVSLLATASILSIFWKEIAEAHEQGDHIRVERLYHKVSRALLMLGAVISCFLIPWSEQLALLLLGDAYADAWPVLAVMFLYPIHQSMGQINGTMFMACKRTKSYMNITLLGMLISIPVSYFMLVSSDEWLIPGLALGALGLAIKMVGLNVFLVNVQGWMLARYHGWKYQWKYQVVGVLSLFGLGYLVKMFTVLMVVDIFLADVDKLTIVFMMIAAGFLYLVVVLIFVWFCPRLFGAEREEIQLFLGKRVPFLSGW